MSNVLELYKKSNETKKDGDVMGVIRTMFPDIEVETFIKSRSKVKKVKKL
jgi:urease gamma subunit